MTKPSDTLWAVALSHLSVEDRQAITFDGQGGLDILKNLQILANEAKAKSIEKRWRCRRPGRGGETVILRDLFSKIATWINCFREIGDIVVQYDPSHAALPWAGVRFLLQVFTNDSGNLDIFSNCYQVAISDINKFDFLVEAAEIMAYSISRFAILEKIYLNRRASTADSKEGLKDALVRLYSSMFVYLAKAKQYFGQSTPSMFNQAPFSIHVLI